MPPTYFPLRWESTGDQWWYAAPVDWAAANGHYDLVRQLLRLDGNHLIKLTSLRRIRRLETVWDDEEQLHDVAKCRSQVARKLLIESEHKKGKNSLIRAGYGGWLLYTAASAGDFVFVQELLQRDPLLVFGEGEYGVTDILYAAARSKNNEVFRLVFEFAVSPRFGNGKELEEQIGEVPKGYKWEMMNRGVHAAARGGNLEVLKDLLGDGSGVSSYRDVQGSTVLHAAAARGQAEVVKYLVASFHIINSTDNNGNTALHVAAYRGQLAVVEALVLSSPSAIYSKNNVGETFLHMAVTGFQTPGFRRLDHRIELMKQLLSGKFFNVEGIVNAKNNDGRTALHLAITGNIHSDLVQLLMTVHSIDVNTRDGDGMTALDLIRQCPPSASSEILSRQLMSAGGIFGCQDYSARRIIASHLKKRSIGCSPGTSFRISDAEIFLYTGIENASDGGGSAGLSAYSAEPSPYDSTVENNSPNKDKNPGPGNSAVQHLKRLLHGQRMKERKPKRVKNLASVNSVSTSEGTPIPLRQRFSKPSSPSNKRTLSARSSNLSSPTAKKKLATGLVQGVMQAMPHLNVPRRRSRSSSFSKSSVSSHGSLDKQKGLYIENAIAGPSCSTQRDDDETPPSFHRHGSFNRKLMNQYFCCGAPGKPLKAPAGRQQPHEIYDPYVLSMA